MKVMDTPRTGKIGTAVFYPSPFGLCCRSLCIPHDPKSPAQIRARQIFGSSSRGWGLKLTESQRENWNLAAQTVPSCPSLDQYSNLSGQQLCVKINSTLRCVGQSPVTEPPAPVIFSPNCVGGLTIDYDEAGNVRLLLAVGTAVEDIMLFGQAPCSAGRMKNRRVNYLGLAGPVVNGQCNITAQYVARFGQPAAGQKVFVVTCQHKNGWKGQDHVTSAIVPPRPLAGEQPSSEVTKAEAPAAAGTPEAQVAPAQGISSSSSAMYKGSTPDARGLHNSLKRGHPVSIPGTPLVHSVKMAIIRLVGLRMAGAGAQA